MKKVSKAVILILMIVGLVSCAYKYGASGENTTSSNLTFGLVKSKIIKNETTQMEILELFGSPNITTKNRSDLEVWSYNKMSAISKGGSTVGWRNAKGSSSSSNSSFDLIITFTEDDVVKDYSVISTKF